MNEKREQSERNEGCLLSIKSAEKNIYVQLKLTTSTSTNQQNFTPQNHNDSFNAIPRYCSSRLKRTMFIVVSYHHDDDNNEILKPTLLLPEHNGTAPVFLIYHTKCTN